MLLKKNSFIGPAAHLAAKPLFETAAKLLYSLSWDRMPNFFANLSFFVGQNKGWNISGLKLVRKLDLGYPRLISIMVCTMPPPHLKVVPIISHSTDHWTEARWERIQQAPEPSCNLTTSQLDIRYQEWSTVRYQLPIYSFLFLLHLPISHQVNQQLQKPAWARQAMERIPVPTKQTNRWAKFVDTSRARSDGSTRPS